MEKNQTNVTGYLDRLTPAQLVADEKVSAKFIELYNAIHGDKLGESIYNKEQFNFMKVLNDNPVLQDCSKLSLYGCFLDVAVNGLSLDNISKPLCYMIPRSVKTGRKIDGKDEYEKRATINITGYGELVMRKRAGQINYADNPVVVYDGDSFEAEIDENGKKVIRYKACIPRKSKKIIAAFIRIVRNDGSTDYQWMLEQDIERLKKFSSRANSYWKDGKRVEGEANALYSSNDGQVDSGFLENKMIKHAFDAYPKVRTGQFTQLETTQEPEINYNLETIPNSQGNEESFVQEQNTDIQEGVVVNDETDTF
jgi:hypothetical protein